MHILRLPLPPPLHTHTKTPRAICAFFILASLRHTLCGGHVCGARMLAGRALALQFAARLTRVLGDGGAALMCIALDECAPLVGGNGASALRVGQLLVSASERTRERKRKKIERRHGQIVT